MICPTMAFATAEDIQTETEQVQDDLEKIVIDRNVVLIKQNTAYPMILDSETNKLIINEKYKISESYNTPQTMKWMNITKDQRDTIVQEIENDGKIFANQWRHVVIYEVIAQRPVSITYKVNGEKKMKVLQVEYTNFLMK